MNTECERIADQVRRAFAGAAWHGPPIRDAFAGISAEQALAKPLASAHSIWDLVLHIELWADIAEQAIHGAPMPRLYGTEKDWPAGEGGDAEWASAKQRLLDCGQRLAASIEEFADVRLSDTVPGRDYNFYYLF